jgi:hypothetical protein
MNKITRAGEHHSNRDRFWTQESTPLVVQSYVPGKSSKCNNSKVRQDRVNVLCTALLINAIYQPTQFLVNIFYGFRVMSRTTSKCKNEQGAITTKFGQADLKFLCTAHLPIEIQLPTKFHVDISCSLRVIPRTRFFKRGDN